MALQLTVLSWLIELWDSGFQLLRTGGCFTAAIFHFLESKEFLRKLTVAPEVSQHWCINRAPPLAHLIQNVNDQRDCSKGVPWKSRINSVEEIEVMCFSAHVCVLVHYVYNSGLKQERDLAWFFTWWLWYKVIISFVGWILSLPVTHSEP